MGEKSAEQVEQEHLTAFGPTLGPVYHALYTEVTWLHAKWGEFRKLYGHSKERIDLLNQSAGFLFRVVQDVLLDDVLLHICRLTDPPANKPGSKNLSLLGLAKAIQDAALASKVRRLANEAASKADFARERRKKRLAHLDLEHALKRTATPLPGVSLQKIEDVLALFRKVLNALHHEYVKSTVKFEEVFSIGDAGALVRCLRRARHVKRQRREWLRQGKLTRKELDPPDND